jgi:hypothetical protein
VLPQVFCAFFKLSRFRLTPKQFYGIEGWLLPKKLLWNQAGLLVEGWRFWLRIPKLPVDWLSPKNFYGTADWLPPKDFCGTNQNN